MPLPEYVSLSGVRYEVVPVPSLVSKGRRIGFRVEHHAKRILINGTLTASARDAALASAKTCRHPLARLVGSVA